MIISYSDVNLSIQNSITIFFLFLKKHISPNTFFVQK